MKLSLVLSLFAAATLSASFSASVTSAQSDTRYEFFSQQSHFDSDHPIPLTHSHLEFKPHSHSPLFVNDEWSLERPSFQLKREIKRLQRLEDEEQIFSNALHRLQQRTSFQQQPLDLALIDTVDSADDSSSSDAVTAAVNEVENDEASVDSAAELDSSDYNSAKYFKIKKRRLTPHDSHRRIMKAKRKIAAHQAVLDDEYAGRRERKRAKKRLKKWKKRHDKHANKHPQLGHKAGQYEYQKPGPQQQDDDSEEQETHQEEEVEQTRG